MGYKRPRQVVFDATVWDKVVYRRKPLQGMPVRSVRKARRGVLHIARIAQGAKMQWGIARAMGAIRAMCNAYWVAAARKSQLGGHGTFGLPGGPGLVH